MFKLAILTISDAGSKGERDDTSGDIISDFMSSKEFELFERSILPDETPQISEKLVQWSDCGNVDVILTTGGTGMGPRDVTPEATREVIDFEVPGITEAMRIQTLKETNFAMLSRAVAGVRNGCLIINFPGSPTGVAQTLKIVADVIPHALEMIRGWRTHKNP